MKAVTAGEALPNDVAIPLVERVQSLWVRSIIIYLYYYYYYYYTTAIYSMVMFIYALIGSLGADRDYHLFVWRSSDRPSEPNNRKAIEQPTAVHTELGGSAPTSRSDR